MKIVIASENEGKIREFKTLLSPLGYEVLSLNEIPFTGEIVEDGKTFEENARIKATAVYENANLPVIADDSGLVVDYLGGEPGIYSARYAKKGERRKKVLEGLKGVPKEKRTARFVCCICYKDENGEKIVTGECEGYIGNENLGENGFGYDPIFMVGDRSFAQLSDDEKNLISHRGKALKKLVEFIGHRS